MRSLNRVIRSNEVRSRPLLKTLKGGAIVILSKELRSKLVRDSEFRNQFKKNPKAEIQRSMGVDLGNKRIKLYESQPGKLFYSIPVDTISLHEADELMRRLIERAQSNPNFKNKLLSKPKKVLSQSLGIKLPAKLKIKVFADSESEICIIIPASPPDWYDPPEPPPGPEDHFTYGCFDTIAGCGGGTLGDFCGTVVDAWTGDPSTLRCDGFTYEMSVDDNCTLAGNGFCTATGGCDGLPTPKF